MRWSPHPLEWGSRGRDGALWKDVFLSSIHEAWLEFLVPKAERRRERKEGRERRQEEKRGGEETGGKRRGGERRGGRREKISGAQVSWKKYHNWTASWLLWERKIP